MTASKASLETAQMAQVPMTIEGASALHNMVRFRWTAWRALPDAERKAIAEEAATALAPAEEAGRSAIYSVLGHKADLMLVHFRDSFDELKSAELGMSDLRLHAFIEPTTSYLSVVELGLYDSSVKLYRSLAERGIEPHTPEWDREVEDTMTRQREAMRARLYPKIPAARYLCFYPMDRKRGEDKNWYRLPIEERQRQMAEHGEVGRRYAGKVQQIITGSIGFDDWEWGVDLFADDPLIFKKLIYEMRFDEVSAVYAAFGTFFIGVRCPAAKLGELLSGKLPE
jgi:hydrogen peroxide-dependent heme synthase